HYERNIYNLAYRLCRDRNEAWDMAQEVFLRVFQNFEKFDPALAFRPWLMKVATNVCLNKIRGKYRGTPTVTDVTEPDGEPLPVMGGPNPAGEAAAKDASSVVRASVAELPLDYRVVVTLRYLEGLSYEEIAQALDLPLGTVKNRLFRSREMLKERLKHLEDGL
ncbi:MAG: sigma-70 family RNA polymerase sigma factor, partial [Planctomycetes bacterium]|nr:sigma-70 family RNA polymerase sigma factor [Planctomycetota bacterium]